MVDFKGLKRKPTLGAPPSLEEASSNLEAPENAPQAVALASAMMVTRSPRTKADEGDGRVDARTMRRTDRTVQFATRVTTDWDKQIRQIAKRDHLLLVEVLEKALEIYEAEKRR